MIKSYKILDSEQNNLVSRLQNYKNKICRDGWCNSIEYPLVANIPIMRKYGTLHYLLFHTTGKQIQKQ